MKLRRIATNMSLLGGSLLICFLVLEIGLRLYNGVPLWPVENLIGKQVNQIKVNLAVRYDELLGWYLKENRAAGTGKETTTTGAYGLRMNSSEITPPAENAILAVGDSFTGGSEVWDHETWPAQAQDILGIPVLNAGAGGYGVDQMVLRAERLMGILKPHTIVVDAMVDDIERTEYALYGGIYKPYFVVEDGELVHKNFPVPHYDGGPRDLGLLRGIFGYSHLVNWTIDRVSGGAWWWRDFGNYYKHVHKNGSEVSCLLMERLKEKTEAADVDLVFAIQFGATHIRGWKEPAAHHVAVAQCVREMGIPVVDFWEPLKAILAEDEERFCKLYVEHDDECKVLGHMSPAGNRFTAEGIVEALREMPNVQGALAEQESASQRSQLYAD